MKNQKGDKMIYKKTNTKENDESGKILKKGKRVVHLDIRYQ